MPIQPPAILDQGEVQSSAWFRVYGKVNWNDNWSFSDLDVDPWDLEPISITQRAKPEIDTAVFKYHAGMIDSPSFGPGFVRRSLYDLGFNFRYVKVTKVANVDGSGDPPEEETLFIGYIVSVSTEVIEGLSNSSTPAGTQRITAVGMEYFLDQEQIYRAFAADTSKDYKNESEEWVQEITDAPTFNKMLQRGWVAPGQEKIRNGNRSPRRAPAVDSNNPDENEPDSPEEASNAVHIFYGGKGKDTQQTQNIYPKQWSAYDIAEYLLRAIAPQEFEWRLSPARAATSEGTEPTGIELIFAALDEYYPAGLAQAGRTVKDILDELFNPRTGWSWRINHTTEAREAGEVPVIEVEILSLAPIPIAVGGETFMPASIHLRELDIGANSSITSLNVQADASASYSKLVVLGERVLTTFSTTIFDPDNEDDSAALEPGWKPDEQAIYISAANSDATDNDHVREHDRFRHVFTTFRLRRDWNRFTSVGGASRPVVPVVDSYGAVTLGIDPPFIRTYGGTFENFVPFTAEEVQTDEQQEFLPPIVVIADPANAGKYIMITSSRGPNCNLRMLDAGFGIELRGQANHVIAGDAFDSETFETNTEPEWDYKTIIATVAMRTDHRVRYEEYLGGDPSRTLTIEVPGAEVWIVVTGTVKGLTAAGDLVPSLEANQIIRDDRPLLRRKAAMWRAWNGRRRVAITAVKEEIDTSLRPGDVITRLTEAGTYNTEANTPVSEVTWEYEAQRTTISTDFIEVEI